MKGDMYDDGTPNPLVVKCPNCGAQMSYDYIHGTWYCTSCGCTEKENVGMSDKTAATKEQHIADSPKYGWVCPKCGKVYAPDVKECEHCNQKGGKNSNTSSK